MAKSTIRKVRGTDANVSTTEPAFLKLQGSIKVGPGSAVDDVRRAREMRYGEEQAPSGGAGLEPGVSTPGGPATTTPKP